MKLFITGGLGHIGSYIIEQDFLKIFDEVIIIDNLLTQRFCSLFDLNPSYNFNFLFDDLKKIDLNKTLTEGDIVIHLAAITNAEASFGDMDKLLNNNFETTKFIADACLKNKAKLFFISSTSVYGTQSEVVDENCSKSELKPQSPYAEVKLLEEDFLNSKFKLGLKGVILRFGTIYGISKGMRFHTAVNKFCWQASFNLPLTVWKTALHQKRPYLSLKDASDAFKFFIVNDLFNGETYNIVSQNLTVKEILEVIKIKIKDVKIEFVDSQIMNQLSYEVDTKKINEIGFNFAGNFKQEILRTLNLLKT